METKIKPEKNFKLFDLSDGNQILFERGDTDEDGQHIRMTTYVNDLRVEAKHGYKDNEIEKNIVFKSINQENAENTYKQMKVVFK